MIKDTLKLIKFKAEAILRREVLEADCLNFTELADRIAQQIINLCDRELNNEDIN